MQFLRVSFLFVLVAFCSLAYGDKACQISTKYLGIAHNADACKEKCSQVGLSCVAWGYTSYRERCTGYFLEREEENTSDTTYSYASIDGSSRGFHFCGIVASPNITTPATSFGTSCSFSLVDLGTHYAEQMCVSACQNLESNNYRGCTAWMWSRGDERCIGLLVRSSYGYNKCGAP